MNMNFDNNEAPMIGNRSLNLSNSEPEQDEDRTSPESNKVQPTSIGKISINPADILCGRGKVSFNHVGNRRFRDLISQSVAKYTDAMSRMEKAKIVNDIVDEIRASGGRFLRQDEKEGTWHALNNAQCREKVGHAVRDATSSLEARKKRKYMQEVAQKNVVNTILAKNGAASFGMDNFMTGFHDASTNYMNGFQDTSGMNMKFDQDSIAMGYNKSPAFPFASHEAPKVISSMGGGGAFNMSSNFVQGFQQPSLISSFRPQQRDELLEDVSFPTNWPSSSTSFSAPSKMKTQPQRNDDDQFLAYIDDVLGPIDPAPV